MEETSLGSLTARPAVVCQCCKTSEAKSPRGQRACVNCITEAALPVFFFFSKGEPDQSLAEKRNVIILLFIEA